LEHILLYDRINIFPYLYTIMIKKTYRTAVILLGSNLGNRQEYMQQARNKIAVQVGYIIQNSSFYETKAWGNETQPDFLNQVLICETNKLPQEVLTGCLSIEKELGRDRKEKWGSRTIDIDILYYENEIIATPELKIPHPYLHERRFTLAPLAEILPDFIHPIFNFSNKELLERCGDKLEVSILNTK
jgi:2-amino-4-hydroxy-6-hydroxymethyldihydropteridine diphosphokinase